MISQRKKNLLITLIKDYIKTAQPVSSGGLVERYKLNISPATVRNELADLEEEGYIHQPHTSSGRVPTAVAYQLFVDSLPAPAKLKGLKEEELTSLEKIFDHNEAAYKQTAKIIADLSGNAVFWAFHKNNLYYTGLANLFAQPEFKQLNTVYDFSTIIDRLEDIIDDCFEELAEGSQVLIGEQNPFGNFLSTVLVKYKDRNQSAVFGLLGPMRMDYVRNLSLAEFINKKFS